MREASLITLILIAMLALIWSGYLPPRGILNPNHGHREESGEPSIVEVSGVPLLESTRNNRVQVLTEHGLYPCTDCHDRLIPNPVRRERIHGPHEQIHLRHGPSLWCLNCHSEGNRNMLRLLDGTEVSFNESHRLCGQCHGPNYRDWLYGVHGKRTGMWNGEKNTWLCVRCHHPHQPKFQPLKPQPPPRTRFQRPPAEPR